MTTPALLTAAWDWWASSNPAQIVSALAAIGGLYRASSNREHRATLVQIKAIAKRIGRIETELGIANDPE